ncbi:hypothetical protein G9A89_011053 [Geosiphon pyriformis]|nr:hypothetical protein G9A89_011053 [Geosiphon pyriformis]
MFDPHQPLSLSKTMPIFPSNIFLRSSLLVFIFVLIGFKKVLSAEHSLLEALKYGDIIAQHDKYDTQNAGIKHFEGGLTLAYVTPWNNHGYDIVKIFKGKFDYVSPVWYNIHRRSNRYELSGGHDVDQNWIKEVRIEIDGQKRGKIVPRFRSEGWAEHDYKALLTEFNSIKAFTKVLVEECRKQNFDGLVLEMGIPTLLRDVIQELGDALHKQSKELILVINPKKPNTPIFTAGQFEDFSMFVDRFSLMTYDYSPAEKPGPSANVDWIEDNILAFTPTYRNRDKLLVGLNMYGTNFIPSQQRQQPILGNSLIQTLKKHKSTIKWDPEAKEHHFEYEESSIKRTVWFPTLKSLDARLNLAEDYSTGLSLWEVGQGLDYFYDLL